MRAWNIGSIVLCLFAFWLSSRIADTPLVGIAVAGVVAALLALGQHVMRRRAHDSPPNRP